MRNFSDALNALLSASPIILALLLAITAVGVAGFALYVVYRAVLRRTDG